MRILPKVKETPAMHPSDLSSYVNLNKIALGIEKADAILEKLNLGGTMGVNHEAIATWERILASLQMRWRDAMIEVHTDGRYVNE